MTLQQDVDVLRRIPLFAKIEPARLKLLAFTSEHVEFAAGEPVCRQGEPGDAAYIVLDGAADVVVQSDRGPMKVAHIGRNDIVGEIAILCDVPRTATVLATTPLVALRVSKDGFFNLVTQFPQVGVEVMHELASRLHQTTHAADRGSLRLRELEQWPLSRRQRLHTGQWPTRLQRGPGLAGARDRVASRSSTICSPSCASGCAPRACRSTRATMHLRTLHPQFQGARVLWRVDWPSLSSSLLEHGIVRRSALPQQPGPGALRGGRRLPPAAGPAADGGDDSEYSIYADLRAEGYHRLRGPADAVHRRQAPRHQLEHRPARRLLDRGPGRDQRAAAGAGAWRSRSGPTAGSPRTCSTPMSASMPASASCRATSAAAAAPRSRPRSGTATCAASPGSPSSGRATT